MGGEGEVSVRAADEFPGAAMRDDMGFNGCDARIGHSLARLSRLSPKQVALGRRLLIKYRRQLTDEVNAKIRDNE